MNNARRKKINDVVVGLEELSRKIEYILDEEQECFDNMPENLQESDRACAIQDSIDNLENAIDKIEDIIDDLSEAAI